MSARRPTTRLLDRQSWVLDGERVIERPAGALRRRWTGRRRARPHAPGRRASTAPATPACARSPVSRPASARAGRRGGRRAVAPVARAPAARSVLIGSLVVARAHAARRRPRHPRRAERRAAPRRADDRQRRGLGRARPRSPLRSRPAARRADGPRRDARRPARADRRRRGATSSASRARSRTSCGRRWPGCACARSSRCARTVRAPTPSARRRSRGVVEHAERVDRRDRRPARGRAPGDRPGERFGRPRRRRSRARRGDVVGPASLPLAEGDPEVVRRALAPLVENARRHARSRGRIELSAARRRWSASPSATTAPASTPALGERAFDPGVRGPGRPSTAAPASGWPSRAAWRARAAATSSSGPAPAAASCSSCPRSAPSRGRCHAVRNAQGCGPHPGGHDHDHRYAARRLSLSRTMLNKVPEITLFFWIIKILCTTVGETAADYLNDTPRLRPDEHDVRDRRAARGPAAGPVPAAQATSPPSTGRPSSSSASSARSSPTT